MEKGIMELIEDLCPDGVEYKKIEEIKKCSFWIMPKTPEYKKEGIPYITSKNIKNGELNFQNVAYISQKDYDNISKNREILPGDILITMIGTIGEACIVKEDKKFYGQNFYLVRLDSDIILNKYYYYYFTQPRIINKLIKNKNTSAQGYIKAGNIEKMEIPIPPLEVQKKIVEILDAMELLTATLTAELDLRKKQYEYYRDDLLRFPEGGVEYKQLYEVTIWDKKFKAVERFKQPQTKKYSTLLAVDLFKLDENKGNVFLLSTGERTGWTTEEKAGKNLCEGEVVAIPWGKSRPLKEVLKYYKGKFVTGDNRIATSIDEKILLTKYLYYFIQFKADSIDKIYRGATIQHPDMEAVLDMKIAVPSLEKQKQIVEILEPLEKLTQSLTEGIPAEIEGRKKQYEYYRDKLLNFKRKED